MRERMCEVELVRSSQGMPNERFDGVLNPVKNRMDNVPLLKLYEWLNERTNE